MLPESRHEIVNAWRETVARGARWLCFSPLVALGIAPVAVFFRAALVLLALWHAYGVWRFTASGAQLETSRLGLWRWVLRALAFAGVVLITLSYEGYRALLIATVAAYLAYLSELLPALGLSPRKRLHVAARRAAVCCALVTGDLALRRWVSGANWGTIPGHCLSALALPLGLFAWLEVDRVRAPGVESEPEAHESPIRGWALKARAVVIPFSLGVLVVLGSLVGAYSIAWNHLYMTPGNLASAVLFVLLCVNGAILLILRTRNRQTLRRTVVGAGLTHIPVWWFLVFPTQFDPGAWKRAPDGSDARRDMARDLIYSRVLVGKTRSEVVELLGTPGSYHGPGMEFYELDREFCKGFLIQYERDTAVAADYFWCD